MQDRDGNTFYIIIDYDKPLDEEGDQYETYFLNLVDTACPICAANMSECAGKEAAPDKAPEPDAEPESEQKYQIKISAAAVVDMIRKMVNWSAEDNWNIPGIYFADDEALVYDVSAAYKPTPKGGWAVKRQREEAAALAAKGLGVSEEADS